MIHRFVDLGEMITTPSVPYIGTYFDVGTGFNFNYLGGLSYEPGQDPTGPLITPTANFVENPWVSPDGTKWLFQNAGSLYVIGVDGTGLTVVYDSANGGADFGIWDPTSTWILVAPRGYITDGADIFRVPADGTGTGDILATIAGGKPVAEPQYSDDGTKILFTRNNNANLNEVWVMDADGTGATQIETFPTQFSGQFGEQPVLTWQPGTHRFTWNDGTLGSPVYKCMGIDGSGTVTLSSGTPVLVPRYRSWLPDGSALIVKNPSVATQIKLVHGDGSGNATWFTTAHSMTGNVFVMPNNLTRVYYDSGNDIYSFTIDPVGGDERNELPSGDGTGVNFGLTG